MTSSWELFELYRRDLQQRHQSESTIYCRTVYFRAFFSWLADQDKPDVREVTFQTILDYQDVLRKHRKSNGEPAGLAYQHSQLHAIAAFFRLLKARGKILLDPCADMPPLCNPKRMPRGLINADQSMKMLQQADLHQPCGFRDRAIMELLYSSGLRGVELCNLTVYDVNLDDRLVRVRQGKGRKDRLVPFGQAATVYLTEYLERVRAIHLARSKHPVKVDHLFLTFLGTPFNTKYLYQQIKKYRRMAGLPESITTHSFRHACATEMLRGGANVRHVQEMLGHAHLSTTQVYTHVVPHDLKKVHRRTAPSENRKVIDVPRFQNHGWKDYRNSGHYPR